MSRAITDLPYAPTLARLALALAIGLFVGIERERRRKEAGLRTFSFAALLGAAGGLLGDPYPLLALALLGVLVVLLNVETLRTGEGAEITTSAATAGDWLRGGARLVRGQTFTPTLLGVASAGLLAWKEALSLFSRTLRESELRAAVLLAILAFVVYPALPNGTVDRWDLIDPRTLWLSVVLIAALGFVNYILLNLRRTGNGAHGISRGTVNSAVTITELATRACKGNEQIVEAAYRGTVLATAAMLVRNGILLGVLAPRAFASALAPLALMLAGALGAVAWVGAVGRITAPAARLASPNRRRFPR